MPIGVEAEPGRAAERDRPAIAISAGDPNGIGPEVVLKCLADSRIGRLVRPLVIGSPDVLREHIRLLGIEDIVHHEYAYRSIGIGHLPRI